MRGGSPCSVGTRRPGSFLISRAILLAELGHHDVVGSRHVAGT
jgi:hypothetical protein